MKTSTKILVTVLITLGVLALIAGFLLLASIFTWLFPVVTMVALAVAIGVVVWTFLD